MKKLVIMFSAALIAATAFCEPGFIRAVFSHPSTGYDGDSDIWTAENTTVVTQPDVYDYTTPEHTTYAYAAYVYMEKGKGYYFTGQYDDYFSVKIDDTMVISKQNYECQGGCGQIGFHYTGWHKIEIRCSNNGGVGGAIPHGSMAECGSRSGATAHTRKYQIREMARFSAPTNPRNS